MKSNLVIRTDKENSRKQCLINIRIISKGVISYIPTGISIPKTEWDKKNQQVKPKSPIAIELNKKIAEDVNEVNKCLLENFKEFMTLDANEIKSRVLKSLNGEERASFISVSKTYVENFKHQGKIGTYDDRMVKLKQILEFKPSISFDKINGELITDFKDYLIKQNNSNNTIHGKVKFLKTLYRNYCGKYNITPNSEMFKVVKIIPKENIKYLKEEQIKEFEKLKFDSDRENLYKTIFLFAVKGIGLRISDILTLKWNHVSLKEESLTKVTKKTEKLLNVKIPVPALKILNSLHTKKTTPDDYIFPILDDNIEDLTDPETLDRAISRETASYNKFLKKCGKKLGLSFRLSSQKGRHSYATRAINRGMPLHDVQYTLGHSSFKETEIYAKILKESVSNSIDKYLSD